MPGGEAPGARPGGSAASSPRSSLHRGSGSTGALRRELRPLRESVPTAEPFRLELRLHYRRGSWAPFAVDDDVLFDLGPHLIDLAGWLARAAVSEVRTHHLTATRARLELRFAGNRGSANIDCATDRLHNEVVAVQDETGRRIVRISTGGLSGRHHGPPAPAVRASARRIPVWQSWRASPPPCAESGAAELATARDGVAVMAAIEAARRSAANGGGWETLATTEV